MGFWEKFYALCSEKGLKPNGVARELGFSSSLCTQWKQGQQRPSYEKASRIAGFFNVPVEYLLSDSATLDNNSDALPTKEASFFSKMSTADLLLIMQQIITVLEERNNKSRP